MYVVYIPKLIFEFNIIIWTRYGTQQPIALLKLLFEKGGMYKRNKDFTWKKLKDVVYLGTMRTPVDGCIGIDPRFLSLCAIFYTIQPKNDTIIYIYQSILKGHLPNFNFELMSAAENLVISTVKLFNVNLIFLCSISIFFQVERQLAVCFVWSWIHTSCDSVWCLFHVRLTELCSIIIMKRIHHVL